MPRSPSSSFQLVLRLEFRNTMHCS